MRRVNLVEYVFQVAEREQRWSEPAIVCASQTLSYEQLFVAVRRFGGTINALGVARGDRVAIVAADCPEWITAFLGTVMVGCVAVPASTMLAPHELQYVLGHSGSKAVVVTFEQLDKIREIRTTLPQLEHVISIDGEEEDALSFNKLCAEAIEASIRRLSDEELAFILYTSGSTGTPKGAMHLHRSLPYTVETCCKEVLDVKPGDRLFSSSRLFFAYGLGNSLSFPLASGATSILCKPRPTPSLIAEILVRDRPTIFFGVPAVYRALLEYGSDYEIDAGSLELCISAGEKLPETIFSEWRSRTGMNILDGIGSTEMLQMFISNRRDLIKPGSSGQVIAGYETRLIDKDGTLVAGAGSGHLMVKGGSSSPGYWNDPEKTAATIEGDWMRTGDLYRRDEDGFYWFEGRSDDLFKVKGLWVSPIEVEEALLSCADVVEAAVVPGQDENGMNAVVAYVVLRSTARAEADRADELRSTVAALLPSFKRPAQIHFVDQLPRTATGKLQRYKLRDR